MAARKAVNPVRAPSRCSASGMGPQAEGVPEVLHAGAAFSSFV
jgi:hypothetical protein